MRTGANFGLQFRPNDKLDINITGLYSKLEADNFNHNYMAWFTQHVRRGRAAHRTPRSTATARWSAGRSRTAPMAGAWCTTPSCATRKPRPGRAISTRPSTLSDTRDAAHQGRLHEGQGRNQRAAVLGNTGAHRLHLGFQPWRAGSRLHQHRRPHRSGFAAGTRLGFAQPVPQRGRRVLRLRATRNSKWRWARSARSSSA